MKKNKITTFKGFGKLTGGAKDGVFTVDVKGADGKAQVVKAKKVVLATGSDARMLPGYKADDTILTNYEILKIAEMPKSLVVIGSGAVGVEFASIFKSFGAEVTILEMLPRVVPVEDEEISKELLRLYKKRGIDVNLSIKDTKIEKNKDGALVTWTDANGKPQQKQAEKVLVAVGRSPRTADIGSGQDEHQAGPRLCDDERVDGDDRAGHLRDWRHRRRDAAVGACGVDGRAGGCGADGGKIRQADQSRTHSRMHVYRSADRFRLG